MDLTLFRALQSIKTIEDDDLEFQTQTIDYDTFHPKYPHVIVVDQKKKQGCILFHIFHLIPPPPVGPFNSPPWC